MTTTAPRPRRIGPWLRLRYWWDDRGDRRRDTGLDRPQRRWRWWLARQVDRLPGQCWADLADFGLNRTRIPWEPRRPDCTADALRVGACYCGKVARADVAALPGGPRARVVLPCAEPASTRTEDAA